MKNRIRLISVLLCTILLFSVFPVVSAEQAEGKTDFQLIVAAGEQSNCTVKIVTDAKYYCDTVQEFNGEYTIFRDALTGYFGIVDYRGKIVYRKAYPTPLSIICNNIFLGNDHKLYDFQGNLIEAFRDLTFSGSDSIHWWTDSETGELIGLLLYPMDTDPMFHVFGTMYSSLAAFDGRKMGDPNDRYEFYSYPVDGKVITCRVGSGCGLSELFGDEILPMEYSVLAFMDKDHLLARKNGVYQFIKPDGTVLKELPYDSIKQLMGDFKVFRVEQNGKYGVMAADGELLIPVEYDSIEVHDGKNFVRGTVGEEQMLVSLDPSLTFCGSRQFPANTKIIAPDCFLIPSGEHKYLVNSQNERLIPESVSSVRILDNTVVIRFTDSEVVRFYDSEFNLLSEITGPIYGVTDESVIIRRAGENGTNSFDFYDRTGVLVNTVKDISLVDWQDNNTYLCKDGKYALADPYGRQLSDYLYDCFTEANIYSYSKKSSPYCCAVRSSDRKTVLLDRKTGKNALTGSATIQVIDFQLGGYFPFFEGDKLGFAKMTTPEESPFRDVSETAWYKAAVKFCYNAGLMAGTGRGYFTPKAKTTRAMAVSVLYRISGEKTASCGFTDVPDGKWYTDAVNWAASKGIVSGKTETTFGPNDPLTREQLVAILYRYACTFGQKEADLSVLDHFRDAEKISDYARTPMAWAVGNGIVSGNTTTTLAPKGTATRAEIASILMRFITYMANEQSADQN